MTKSIDAMTDSPETVDGEVLRLRSAGRTFARIAREVGLERPILAQRAFERAMRRLPEAEQDQVRQQEMQRLDLLAARIMADTNRQDEDRSKRLAAIDRLRLELNAKT
jgi:transposase